MQGFDFYSKTLNCNSKQDVFDYFFANLEYSNPLWSYFISWEKNNVREVEIALNSLNYLIGKDNFDKEFKRLAKSNPAFTRVLPALSLRDGRAAFSFRVSVDYESKKFICDDYSFTKSKLTKSEIDSYLNFMEITGLRSLIQSRKVNNFVDYICGVESGLDCYGSELRETKSMEAIVKVFVESLCKTKQYRYLKEANAAKIYSEWGIKVPVDKSSRRYDFVINNGKELFIIETNFYGGGGSKLKSTAGEYRNLFDTLDNKFKFIWITDGLGWNTAKLPLRETFEHNDYVFSLDMLENGILEELI